VFDPKILERNRIVAAQRADAASMPFDVLRTRLLKICAQRNWTRIGVTSPYKGCGKTHVVANLAISIARQTEARVLLLDFDLRAPALAARFGIAGERRIAGMLLGETPPEAFFIRAGDRLALGVNTQREPNSAELLQSDSAARAQDAAAALLRPTVMLYDLPPLLTADDALGMLDRLDGVILVVAAGETSPAQLRACEESLTDSERFIGVILNKFEDPTGQDYNYDYGY
jgi:Mrp family chromosome partitioning ATPase